MSIWQKIWFWTKLGLGALVVIHTVLFIVLNMNVRVQPTLSLIYTRYESPSVLWVVMWTAVLSVVGWWLFRAVYKTLRQMQDAYDRQSKQKMERDVADMQEKVAMLQTRADPTPTEATPDPNRI